MGQNRTGTRGGGGRRWTKELNRQREEGVPISALQMKQIQHVFSETTGTLKGVVHNIHVPPGVIVRAPMRPTPRALKDVIEWAVQVMLQLGMVEESTCQWSRPPRAFAHLMALSIFV